MATRRRDGSRTHGHLQVVVEEPGDPVEAVFDLDLAALVGGIYANLARDVGKVRNPLDAELGVAEWLAMTTAMVDASPADQDAVVDLMTALVDEALAAGTPQALALLRALSSLTGTAVAEAADAAAAELVAAGQPDRVWVTTMTRLEPTTCLRYAQIDGSQESLVLGFRYGTREHAISVLIDHGLGGGGIKDCWLTSERPDAIHQNVATMVMLDPRMEVGPTDWVTAERVVAGALSRPVCGTDAEQISNTAAFGPLLRRRLDRLQGHPWRPSGLLPQRSTATKAKGQDALWDVAASAPEPAGMAGPRPGAVRAAPPVAPPSGALVLKINLDGARPPIWRRLLVPDTTTLERLHTVIQVAFGWSDTHLHLFAVGREEYGPMDGWNDCRSERISLSEVAKVGTTFVYVYDFGDDWRHTIMVEKRVRESGLTAARCLAGRRAAPPEDCGGTYGYGELLGAIARPDTDPETLAWAADALGTDVARLGQYDPDRFDADEISIWLGSL